MEAAGCRRGRQRSQEEEATFARELRRPRWLGAYEIIFHPLANAKASAIFTQLRGNGRASARVPANSERRFYQ